MLDLQLLIYQNSGSPHPHHDMAPLAVPGVQMHPPGHTKSCAWESL